MVVVDMNVIIFIITLLVLDLLSSLPQTSSTGLDVLFVCVCVCVCGLRFYETKSVHTFFFYGASESDWICYLDLTSLNRLNFFEKWIFVTPTVRYVRAILDVANPRRDTCTVQKDRVFS